MGFGKFYTILVLGLILVIVGGNYLFGDFFGDECYYDVRYKNRDGVDESVTDKGKVYFFKWQDKKANTVVVPNEMGIIKPELIQGEEYYVLAVDFNSRGSLYQSVEVLHNYLEAIGIHDEKIENKIARIALIGEEREHVTNNLERLAELDEEALKIAKTIDLSEYGELKEVFLFTDLDTPNVNGEYITAVRGTENIYDIRLQDETDIHIY